jgi:hypothetical protein
MPFAILWQAIVMPESIYILNEFWSKFLVSVPVPGGGNNYIQGILRIPVEDFPGLVS